MSLTQSISRRGALGTAGALGLTGALSAHAGTAPAHAAESTEALIGAAGQTDLHVMTFNIRLDLQGTLPGQADYWPERIAALQAVLELEKPTVMGIQEALFHQLPAVEDAFPKHYRMVGFGRDGGSAGEYSAIFYDARRLSVVTWDQFWLSDQPDLIGSATWGNTVTRIVTWARFKDQGTGKEFILVNTHFDHQSENARILSARAIVDLMNRFSPKLPTVVIGDFNSAAESSGAYDTLVGSGVFHDTWKTAAQQLTPAYDTFPNYKDPVLGGTRIDWVLATPGITSLKAAINTFTLAGRYPSDHAPVQALIRLP